MKEASQWFALFGLTSGLLVFAKIFVLTPPEDWVMNIFSGFFVSGLLCSVLFYVREIFEKE